MAVYKCESCGASFSARDADRARGWARSCSKSCAAHAREKAEIKKAKSSRSWQRFDLCVDHEDRLDLARNPYIIEPLYNEYGERDGETFYAGGEGWGDHK